LHSEYYNYILMGCDVVYQHFRGNILPSYSRLFMFLQNTENHLWNYSVIMQHTRNYNHHSSCSEMTNLYQKRKVNCEQCHLAGLTACSSKSLTFRGNISPPSSGRRAQLTACFLLGIFLNPKNGDNIFLWNFWLSLNYTALQARTYSS
jgi:hypothetical protein